MLAAAMLASSAAAYAGEALNETKEAQIFTEADQEPVPGQKDLSAGQFTAETIQLPNGNSALVHSDNGRVYFVEGNCSSAPVKNMEDAEKVLSSLTGLLGGDDRIKFEPWRMVTDPAGNCYYIFFQMYADTTVSGGAVKIITDADGNMLGMTCSMETELPEVEAAEGISAEQAEEIVREHAEENGEMLPEILEGMTTKIILPVNKDLDPYSEEEKEESRFVWAVYSNNSRENHETGSDLPYLAHYVTTGGEYLYSLPTIMPGDEAAEAGYDASYVFEFMEPAEYSGTVMLADGSEKEINIDLMRDSRTGMYYLGNIERRIAVADCYEFLYNQGSVVMEASPDNSGWDENCLLALYNYCRAWDYYNEIGWNGGDGFGTPIMILKDFCDEDHTPIDNAAYAGRYYGWQLFLSSSANQLSQCLDVLGHEFTHCVTGSVMTYNAYMNDYGAINEAISDIQGNICEKMYEEDEDPEWRLGEDIESIRSMSSPRDYQQPEYTWDVYYMPEVQTPTDLNDRGGVHSNSSLLNHIAYRLCEDGGMTLDEARSFWFATDCTMVPGTDYRQLSELLPWVLGNLGMDQYQEALKEAIAYTRIGSKEMPENFEADQALVTLTLPDSENFNDGNWGLFILSLDTDKVLRNIGDLFSGAEEYKDALPDLIQILADDLLFSKDGGEQDTEETEAEEEADSFIADLLSSIFSEQETEGEETFFEETEGEELLPKETEGEEFLPEETEGEEMLQEEQREDDDITGTGDLTYDLAVWAKKYLGSALFFGQGSAGDDGHTIRMVSRPGLTIPVLVRFETKPGSMQPKSLGLGVYIFDNWIDLGEVAELFFDPELLEQTISEDSGNLSVFGLNLDLLVWMKDLFENRDKIFFRMEGGEINEIPSEGIENLTILDEETVDDIIKVFEEAIEAEAGTEYEADETEAE